MYPKEEIAKFKGDLKTNLQDWCEGKIDALFPNNPKVKTLLKNGLNNWMAREDAKINKYVDMALLFVTDENGAVNVDTSLDLLIELFKETPVQTAEVFGMPVSYGKGEIVLTIPHNIVLDMIFGNLGQIRLTSDDLLELKELFDAA